MEEFLKDHPALAPEVAWGVLSKALTATQSKVKELEQVNAELSKEAATGKKAFAELQVTYERELANGQEVRETLEQQFIDLRVKETALEVSRQDIEKQREVVLQNTKTLEEQYSKLQKQEIVVEESRLRIERQTAVFRQSLEDCRVELGRKEIDVENGRREVEEEREQFRQTCEERYDEIKRRESALKKGRRAIEDKMEAFKEATELLVRKTDAEANALQEHLAAVVAEKTDLEQAQASLSAQNGALFRAHLLQDKLDRVESAHCEEVGKRRKAETILEDTHAQLASNTIKFERHFAASEGAQRNLWASLSAAQARLTAMNAEHMQLEAEVQELRARQAVMDETRHLKDASVGTKDAEEADEVTTSERERMMENYIDMLHAQVNELNCALTAYKIEKKDAETAMKAKDLELFSQREKSDGKIAGLKEKLRTTASAADSEIAALEGRIVKLLETLKRRMLEISDFKKKIGQLEQKSKANKLTEAAEADHSDLTAAYAELYENYIAQTEIVTARDSVVEEWVQKFQALTGKHQNLQENMEKLQSVSKNLRSSALRARAEAQENANLQKELTSLKERFSDVIKERDQLLCKKSMSSATPRYCRREQDPHSNYDTRSSSEDDRHDRHRSERYSEDEKTQVCPTHLTAIFEQTQGQQPSKLFNEPARLSQSEERLLYHNFIKKNFACPSGRPAFKDIQPIHTVGPCAEIFTHDISTNRLSLHFPKRSLWCSSVCDHALVFAPTHEYRHASDTWVNSSRMVSNCGQTFDLFMNKGDLVFYVGIYRVHSLRMVHPPGAKIPTDVSRAAILLAAGLHQRSQTKVNECFPDGEMRTECFGLQCVGFDNKLYDSLRERYLNIDGGKKRKAGPEDVRNDGKKKLQRV